MTQNDKPALFVVDGSNIATEGRSQPSLEQLNDAVDAFRSEYPDVNVTVVVDATFGHRIAKKEVKAFDKAVAANELVTPPAGAVGRGDAFILAIADKAKAGVFSNDSFQEFHGDYKWLFETGRLIGGKPVPHVGWVFVDRNPVRGRISRESIKAAKGAARSDASPTESKERAQRRVRKKSAAAHEPDVSADDISADEVDSAAAASESVGVEPAPRSESPELPITVRSGRRDSGRSGSTSVPKGQQINQPAAFFDFVEHHPTGSWVNGVVETYASHGAYARVGEVLVYIPLRLMAAPAPSSARKVLKLGDEIEIVIVAFVPDRLSIDGALPAMAPSATTAVQAGRDVAPSVDDSAEASADVDDETTPTKQRSSRRRSRKRGAAPAQNAADETPETQAASTREPAKRGSTRKSAAKAPAKKAPAKKAGRSSGGRSSSEAGEQGSRAVGQSSGGDAAATKPAARKGAAKKPAAKKSAAKKRAAKKPATKQDESGAPAKVAATKGAATKVAAKKAAAKKPAAKRDAATAPAKQPASKQPGSKQSSPAKQTASKRAAGGRRSSKKAASGGGEASS